MPKPKRLMICPDKKCFYRKECDHAGNHVEITQMEGDKLPCETDQGDCKPCRPVRKKS